MLVLDRDGTLLSRAEASLLDHASGQRMDADGDASRKRGIIELMCALLLGNSRSSDQETLFDRSRRHAAHSR